MLTEQRPTVLVAEDDDGHAFLIEDSLRSAGMNAPTIRFADGQEAMDFLLGQTEEPEFNPKQPYLMLLDLRMPKMDGLAVLQKIKSDEHLRTIPVIILTTTDNPDEIERCHRLGCNAYLHKPIAFQGFTDVLSALGKFISFLELPPPGSDRPSGECFC